MLLMMMMMTMMVVVVISTVKPLKTAYALFSSGVGVYDCVTIIGRAA